MKLSLELKQEFLDALSKMLDKAEHVEINIHRGADDVTDVGDSYQTLKPNTSQTITIDINGGAHDRDLRSLAALWR